MSFSNPGTFIQDPPCCAPSPPSRVYWIGEAVRGVGPSSNPSDFLQTPVNWEDKAVWGCPTMAQLHPSLLPPGSIMRTFNQAVLTLGPSETLRVLCQALGRCCSLYAWSLVSLASPQTELTQPCFGPTGSTCLRVPAAVVGAPPLRVLVPALPHLGCPHSAQCDSPVRSLEAASPQSTSRAAG